MRREDLAISREEEVVNAIFTWNKIAKDGHAFLGILLQHVHFQSLSFENLLCLGHTTLSGQSGDDLHREVEDALTRKRTQSPGTFQSKRRRSQQWSSFLGAILSWNPAGLSASARPVGGGAATGIDDLGLCCYLSISASGEVFVSDWDNQRLVGFQVGSGDLVVGNADVGPLLCTPSGVLYVASRNGRTVAKVVGSTLETVIASETLPVDMQFAACRVFATKEEVIYLLDNLNLNQHRILCINPAESLEPVVVGQISIGGRSFLSDLFETEGGTIYVADLYQRKVLAFHPGSTSFTEVLQCPDGLHPIALLVSGQIVVFEYGGAAGNWESVWIFATSWTSAWVKKSPAGSRGFQGAWVKSTYPPGCRGFDLQHPTP